MALIKCKECGSMISDRATKCPKCGCPIDAQDFTKASGNERFAPSGVSTEPVYYYKDDDNGNKNKWLWAVVVVLALAILSSVGYYFYQSNGNLGASSNQQASFNSNEIEEKSDTVDAKDAIVELTPEFIKAIEKYEQLGIFSEGYAAVRKGDRWGYINTKGEEVIPCNIDASCVGPFSEGLAFVDNNEIVGHERIFSVIDYNGNVIFKGKNYLNESTMIESHDLPCFINGKICIPTYDYKYDYKCYNKQGKILKTTNEKPYFISQKKGVGYVSFYIKSGDRMIFGIKDSSNNIIIPAKYDNVACDNPSNGVFFVALDEASEPYDESHWGYVDLKGNDTFSDEIKQRCKKLRRREIQKRNHQEDVDSVYIYNDTVY